MVQSDFINRAKLLCADAESTALARLFIDFCKLSQQTPETDPEQFLMEHMLPAGYDRLQSVIDSVPDHRKDALFCLTKYFDREKIQIKPTVCGPAVARIDAETSLKYFESLTPVYPLYSKLCRERLGMEPRLDEYHKILLILGKSVRRERWHPYCLETEYMVGCSEDVQSCISAAMQEIRNPENCACSGLLTPQVAANLLDISEKRMVAWMQSHQDACRMLCGMMLISLEMVQKLNAEWRSAFCINEPFVHTYFPSVRDEAVPYLVESLGMLADAETNILPANAYPQQTTEMVYCRTAFDGKTALQKALNTIPALPLILLGRATGRNIQILKRMAVSGCLHATKIGDAYYLDYTEYNRQLSIVEDYISLDSIVGELSTKESNGKFTIRKKKCCDEILEYCREHSWWGIDHITTDDCLIDSKQFSIAIRKADRLRFGEKVSLFLSCYGKRSEDKLETIIRANEIVYPIAASILREAYSAPDQCPANLWIAADMLFYCLADKGKDINQLKKKEIKQIVTQFRQECPLTYCDTLADILRRNNLLDGQVRFTRSGYTQPGEAYSIENFAVISSMVCCPNIWQEQDLIQKAVDNPKLSQLWLYVACHMFSTLRDTDMIRLEPPNLPCDASSVLQMISDAQTEIYGDCGKDQRAIKNVTKTFLAKIDYLAMSPHKTASTPNVSPIYFFVPQSNYDTFGLILAIAAAHYELSGRSGPFVVPSGKKSDCLTFFGADFVAACGDHSFSGKRASKALMQAIELEARESGGVSPYVAYTLASTMRSHKGGYAKLAETTEIYLRDANFANLTPEFVAKQLFERGIMSFVADSLLEKSFGKKYAALPVTSRTKMIQSVGLDTEQVISIRDNVLEAQNSAYEVVNKRIHDRKDARQALDNLLANRAVSKDLKTYCLCVAADTGCMFPTRQNCFGCKCEIRTKATYQLCLREWYRLSNTETMSSEEKKRNLYLRNTVLKPMIGDLFAHLPPDTNEAEFNEYLAIKIKQSEVKCLDANDKTT